MKIELLIDGNIFTTVETNTPEIEFEAYKKMFPEINGWHEHQQPLEELKTIKIKESGAEFARRRDAIRWIDGCGWDSAAEDITNFMAAFTPLLVAQSGSTFYKVWTNESKKEILQFNYSQMQLVYETVRSSQLEDYAWYEITKAAIEACTTKEEVEAITW